MAFTFITSTTLSEISRMFNTHTHKYYINTTKIHKYYPKNTQILFKELTNTIPIHNYYSKNT